MNQISILDYARLRFFDWLFCTLIAAGLSVNILAGFEMSDSVSGNLPLMILFSAVLMVFCYLGLYSRKTAAGLSVLLVVLLIAVIVYARNTGIFGDDANYSHQILIIVTVMVCIVTSLLSVSRAGTLVLFASGSVICAASAFLQFPVKGPAYILFLTASLLMALYRVFSRTVRKSLSQKQKSGRFELHFVVQMIGISLAGLLLAAGVFAFVIRPLDPPTDELKLIEKLEKSQIIERTGIETVYTFPDYSLRSQDETDSKETTNQPQETDDPDKLNQNKDTLDETQDEGTVDEKTVDAQAIRYDLDKNYIPLIVLLILLAIALPFVIRELTRKRWYQKLQELSPESQTCNLYLYYLRLFERLGAVRQQDMTLREFAEKNRRTMEPYDAADVRFEDLTDVYVKLCYGRHEITEAECDLFHIYFDGLRKRIRQEKGNFRFLLKYFLI